MIGFRGNSSKTFIEMTLSGNKVTNKRIKKPLRERQTSKDFEESIINDKKMYVHQLSIQSNKMSMYLKSLNKKAISNEYKKRKVMPGRSITKPYGYNSKLLPFSDAFEFDHPNKDKFRSQYPSHYFI